ncbi:MAG: hypothetical protein PHF84_05725 [bacterium]|nr:hypothetical protein [bacterium]
MKNFKTVLVICLLLVAFTMTLYAAYSIKRTAVFTARVNVTGATNTALYAQIFNRLTSAADTIVSWSNINLPLPSGTAWRIANHYVRMTYTNFLAPWGITFAADNTNTAIAKPKFTGSVDVGGVLVNSNLPSAGLQLAWQVQQDTASYQPPRIADPQAGAFTNTGWAWKYMLNQMSTAWSNRAENDATMGTASVNYYATPVNQSGRLWGSAAAERGACSSPVYIYLAADFSTASISIYKSTALTVEMFKP